MGLTHLVKAEFFSEWNTEFGHASLHSIIGAVQSRITLYAPVLHFAQSLGQRVAYGEPAAAVGHAVREKDVLQVTLRQRPNVVVLGVVVFSQHPYEVVCDEDGVIVAHDEPPDVLEAQTQRFGDDPRDPNGGAVTLLVGVSEAGGIAGDLDGREAIAGLISYGAVQPDYASHGLGLVPEFDVVLPLGPQLGRGRNAENYVLHIGLLQFRFRFETENLGRSIYQGGACVLCDVVICEQ